MPLAHDNAYDTTYPFDGFDPITERVIYRQKNYPTTEALIAHQTALSTRILAFFGIPNSLRTDGSPLWLSILKNFFYWPEDPNASTLRKVLGVGLGILFLPFRLLSVIGSTLVHTLMLFTELLPLTLHNLCKEKFGEDSIGAKIFYWMHFVGRAITSPIENFRAQAKEYIDIRAEGKNPSWSKMIASGIISGLFYAGLIFASLIVSPYLLGWSFAYAFCYSSGPTYTNLQLLGDTLADEATASITSCWDILYGIKDYIRSPAADSRNNDATAVSKAAYEGPGSVARTMTAGEMTPLVSVAEEPKDLSLPSPPLSIATDAERVESDVTADFVTRPSAPTA